MIYRTKSRFRFVSGMILQDVAWITSFPTRVLDNEWIKRSAPISGVMSRNHKAIRLGAWSMTFSFIADLVNFRSFPADQIPSIRFSSADVDL